MNLSTTTDPVNLAPEAIPVAGDVQLSSLDRDKLVESRIMILDDESATTDAIVNYLTTAGFRNVRPFNDPARAVQSIRSIQPDIILLDIRMPRINGIEILKFLRTRDLTRYVPVIVLSAALDEKTRLTVLNSGANDFINKPVDSRELVARVSNALYFKHHTDTLKQHAELVQRELEFDSLTQLRNRRSFDRFLNNRASEANVRPFSLILFDIDRFKSINDFHGHRAGDLVLKQVAEITHRNCEPIGAFSARVGGDEFAIICDGSAASARGVAEKITEQLDAHPVQVENHSICPNISVGVAESHPGVTLAEVLFDQADKALYQSKGRNGSSISIYDCVAGHDMDHGYLRQGRSAPIHQHIPHQRSPEEARILVVDDEPAVTDVIGNFLKNSGFERVETENDAHRVLGRISTENPDLIILDIRMPGINGLEILKTLRTTKGISSIPVLVMTSSADDRIRMAALKLQANDFLTKPAKPAELATRVRNALLMKIQNDQLRALSARLQFEVNIRTDELFATRRETILCLARTAESRDTETGNHVLRVGKYAGIIGRSAGLDEDFCAWLELAAQLHDVGKISIPDAILYKPSELTEEEFAVMKMHCEHAGHIFGGLNDSGEIACTSPLLQMAARIAATHHERWDGRGYPKGLSGTDIPIEGRITAVADVFDALGSARKYKQAFSIEKCFELLKRGRGTQFDPDILDAFFRSRDKILEAMQRLN